MARNLDMDSLRTLAAIAETGTFAAAATRIGRTQAAVSHQVKRLEEQAGIKLFARDGRRKIFTEAGMTLLGYAYGIIEANDTALNAVAEDTLSGVLRVGAIQDFAETALPEVLSRFRSDHPRVRFNVRIDASRSLSDAVRAGDLDLALVLQHLKAGAAAPAYRAPMVWVAAADFKVSKDSPLPLVLFDEPCTFREAALTALAAAGWKWEVVYTSPSLSGLRAAVAAGLGVSVRLPSFCRDGLGVVDKKANLPALPEVAFTLYRGKETALSKPFGEAVLKALAPVI